MMRALIDTCIVIDVLEKREPFWKHSFEVFEFVAKEQIEGIITAKSLTDIYYLNHRYTHDSEATKKVILKLLELFIVADTMAVDCSNALLSKNSDFEDSVMIETAKRLNVDYIITRNINDYKDSPIAVLAPKDFSELVRKN